MAASAQHAAAQDTRTVSTGIPGIGAVRTETNAAAANEVVIYSLSEDGSLTPAPGVSPGGLPGASVEGLAAYLF